MATTALDRWRWARLTGKKTFDEAFSGDKFTSTRQRPLDQSQGYDNATSQSNETASIASTADEDDHNIDSLRSTVSLDDNMRSMVESFAAIEGGYRACEDGDEESGRNNADDWNDERDALLDAEEFEDAQELAASASLQQDLHWFASYEGESSGLEICQICNSPLVFSTHGDRLVCRKPSCTNHSFAVCDNTVSSLAYGEEAYMFATFNHMSASKPRKLQKRENDIFGRTTWVTKPALINYMRLCIQQSLRITKASEITVDDVFACAKIHGWTSLYHEKLIPVFAKITGRPMPTLSEKLRKCANDMFLMARDAYFTKGCKPESRQNFMDYLYLWYKIYQLIGATHLLTYIRLLDEKNLKKHDEIFERICKVLNWRFIKTKARPKAVITPLIDYMVDANGERIVPNLPPGVARVVDEEEGTERLVLMPHVDGQGATPKKPLTPAAQRKAAAAAAKKAASAAARLAKKLQKKSESASQRRKKQIGDEMQIASSGTASPKHKRTAQRNKRTAPAHGILTMMTDEFDLASMDVDPQQPSVLMHSTASSIAFEPNGQEGGREEMNDYDGENDGDDELYDDDDAALDREEFC